MVDFLHMAALVGLTLLIVRSTVFSPIRRAWPALLRCSQCTGVWVGVLAGATGLVSVGRGRVLDAVIVGAATSFLAQMADAVFIHLLGEPNSDEEKQ